MHSKLIINSGDTLTLSGTISLSGSTSGAGTLALTGGDDAFGTGAALSTSAWSLSGAGTAATLGEALTYVGAFSAGAGTQTDADGGALTLRARRRSRASPSPARVRSVEPLQRSLGLGLDDRRRCDRRQPCDGDAKGGSITIGDAVATDKAELFNAAAGTWDIADNSGIAAGADAASFIDNAGLIEKTGGTGTSTVAPAIINTGKIVAASGNARSKGRRVGGRDGYDFRGVHARVRCGCRRRSDCRLHRVRAATFISALCTSFSATISGYDTGGAGGTSDAIQLLGNWTETGFSENSADTLATLTLSNGTTKSALHFAGD